MYAATYLMCSLNVLAFQQLRRGSIGLMLPLRECLPMVDKCQDSAAKYEEYCGAKQDLQGAGRDLRHRLSESLGARPRLWSAEKYPRNLTRFVPA